MQVIKGGVTSALGFYASSAEAGLHYKNRDDMAMVFSDAPCSVAGVFTQNVVKAAPVLWDQQIVEFAEEVHALVINSGIANACTGGEGLNICRSTSEAAETALSIPEGSVCIASTGVIGPQLDMSKIKKGIRQLAAGLDHTEECGTKAAKAIMTTDTHEKQGAVQFELGGKTVTLGGMAKGSGMIHPNMCTMLAFITTDAVIEKELLQEALSASADETFNMISVDGDTSTNDTCLILANGESGAPGINKADGSFNKFCEALGTLNRFLARQLAGDGEGATSLITCNIKGASDVNEARVMAKSVISSSLVKAAVFGNDANWGRILCAMGYSGVQFDPEVIDLSLKSSKGEINLIISGTVLSVDEAKATDILSADEVIINADIKKGKAQATAWGCDLSYDYVKINADYRS